MLSATQADLSDAILQEAEVQRPMPPCTFFAAMKTVGGPADVCDDVLGVRSQYVLPLSTAGMCVALRLLERNFGTLLVFPVVTGAT